MSTLVKGAASHGREAAGQVELGGRDYPQYNPNFWLTQYPWAGLFTCLVATYQLDLPHLRQLTLEQIEKTVKAAQDE